ncbi:MAG: hypothetical protein K6T85_07760 [Gorillibacterium sp.]|nr:hypothetical protein [Gorillibacterium sp.]
MDLSTWQMVADVKAGILEIACALLEDNTFPREAAVLDLLLHAKNLQEIESRCEMDSRSTVKSLFEKLDKEGSNPHAKDHSAASSAECKAELEGIC